MKPTGNYFVVCRSLFKNPLWNSEPFTKAQAWIDLFGKANHKKNTSVLKGQAIVVKRGQTSRSINTLAENWKWSRNKVKRFLKRLADERMIVHEVNHLTSIITICNYDKYQFMSKDNEPSNEPSDEPSDEPQTNKDINNDKINTPNPLTDFDAFIKAIPEYIKSKWTDKQILDKSEDLVDYCRKSGKQYKNYYSALRTFLKKDSKEKTTDPSPLEEIKRQTQEILNGNNPL